MKNFKCMKVLQVSCKKVCTRCCGGTEEKDVNSIKEIESYVSRVRQKEMVELN